MTGAHLFRRFVRAAAAQAAQAALAALAALATALPALPLFLGGCMFAERSFPLDPAKVVRVPATPESSPTARAWLVQANQRLKHLLPPAGYGLSPMLTADLVDANGRPVDMAAHFRIDPDRLESLWYNFQALVYSAQAINRSDGYSVAAPWPGFEDIWIPVNDGLKLAGRMGLARQPGQGAVQGAKIADADCIVILPGLRGSNEVLRQHDLARALLQSGFHVLTLELRGHGQTEVRYPDVTYTWGVLETDDLLAVADWLQRQPHIRRTGLVGYSWSSNHVLMAAWREGLRRDECCTSPQLARCFGPAISGRLYQAGVVAFSPILRFEDLLDTLETEHAFLVHPVLAGMQDTVRECKRHQHYPDSSGSMRKLIESERPDYPGSLQDSLRFMRLMPYKGQPCHNKLADVRVPVLMVHAADDMIAPVQTIADMIAGLDNPNVAAIVTPSGGHIGFAPYSSAWYYSLIINFFDPATGPAGVPPRGTTQPDLASARDPAP